MLLTGKLSKKLLQKNYLSFFYFKDVQLIHYIYQENSPFLYRMKISFKNDYSEGCHPDILQNLVNTNSVQQQGYGNDDYCRTAQDLLRKEFGAQQAQVFFVTGGTQANLLAAAAFLKPFESIIAAETGHINTNETGAVEATGHRINSVNSADGKITIGQIEEVLALHTNIPHQVQPKLVYISQATELGTVYTKHELQILRNFCDENSLFLFMDGARLAQALASDYSGLQPEDLGVLTDAFYFGGTKNGALLGEAVVINNQQLQADFPFHMKQRGALLAKSRILGIQFSTLMQNRLYYDLAKHANNQAFQIAEAFRKKGISFLAEPQSNQIFPVLSQQQIGDLSADFEFYVWKKIDHERSAIRLITSWATAPENTSALIQKIDAL